MSSYVDVYGMLRALRERLGDELSEGRFNVAMRDVNSLQGKATAYVWGREDQAGTKIREAYGRELTDASWEFGHMVGIAVAMYYLQSNHDSGYPWNAGYNIRDCFAAFTAGRDLWEYVDSRWPS